MSLYVFIHIIYIHIYIISAIFTQLLLQQEERANILGAKLVREIYKYIYIYMYIEREIERKRNLERESPFIYHQEQLQ